MKQNDNDAIEIKLTQDEMPDVPPAPYTSWGAYLDHVTEEVISRPVPPRPVGWHPAGGFYLKTGSDGVRSAPDRR
ncbi:MAG TPA: hypothetical protein VI756_11450 [Blastocatellia bacterium]